MAKDLRGSGLALLALGYFVGILVWLRICAAPVWHLGFSDLLWYPYLLSESRDNMMNNRSMFMVVIVVAVAIAVLTYTLDYRLPDTQDEPIFSEPVFVKGHSTTILTDKEEYVLGEPIRITVKNTGSEETRFGNTSPSIIIRNSLDMVVFEIYGEPMISFLQPGEKFSIVWDQTYHNVNNNEFQGKQIRADTYVASTSGEAKSAQFIIR